MGSRSGDIVLLCYVLFCSVLFCSVMYVMSGDIIVGRMLGIHAAQTVNPDPNPNPNLTPTLTPALTPTLTLTLTVVEVVGYPRGADRVEAGGSQRPERGAQEVDRLADRPHVGRDL